MPTLINEIQSAWANPAMRHAMMVHFPVVMALLGVPLVLFITFAGRRRTALGVGTGWYLLTAFGCFVASRSGGSAEAALSAALSPAAFDRVDLHGSIGARLWLPALVVAVALAVAATRATLPRLAGQAVAVAMSIVLAGLVLITAHHGGMLVYAHGAGIQTPVPGPSVAAGPNAEGIDDPRRVFHREAVRPILAGSCIGCHSPGRSEGGLDLTRLQSMLVGGTSGMPAVVAGRPEESALIAVVRGVHPTLPSMPPDGPLDPMDISVLERWILEGAAWSE